VEDGVSNAATSVSDAFSSMGKSISNAASSTAA
jgi:hypothetical protein